MFIDIIFDAHAKNPHINGRVSQLSHVIGQKVEFYST